MSTGTLRTRTFSIAATVWVLLAVIPLSSALAGDSLVVKITAVKSANLVTLDYGAGTYDIRISGIELAGDEAMRARATQAMSSLLLGKTVRLRFDGRAPDGTMYGRIYVGGIGRDDEPVRDAGVELVRTGFVRGHDDGYKYGEMSQAETEARNTRRGLWRRSEQ